MGAPQSAAVLDDLKRFAAELPAATPEELNRRDKERQEASRRVFHEAMVRDAVQRWSEACPPALQESDWAHPGLAKHQTPIRAVLGYQLGPKGILASGAVSGQGKSRVMWALMRRFAGDGMDAVFYSAHDWFAALQQQVVYGRDDARGWIEATARRQIVFLDDFGQHSVARAREDWCAGWFFRFLDLRVGHQLPLFMTTNMTARQLAGRQKELRGDPMLRRILDLCEPISFK